MRVVFVVFVILTALAMLQIDTDAHVIEHHHDGNTYTIVVEEPPVLGADLITIDEALGGKKYKVGKKEYDENGYKLKKNDLIVKMKRHTKKYHELQEFIDVLELERNNCDWNTIENARLVSADGVIKLLAEKLESCEQ